jgi:Holliday junction resolvase RusA-like endonuclease
MTARNTPEIIITVEETIESGVVFVRGSVAPVSLQASGIRRSQFKKAVSAVIERDTSGVFTADVRIEFEWYISVENRYETHLVSDLDNVLKPLIDAISGPNRLMIDDNQVQNISAAWMDARIDNISFELRISNVDSRPLVPRAGLYFSEVAPGLCLPLFDAHRGKANDASILSYQIADWIRRDSIDAGISPDVAAAVMPIQRVFPRARLGNYRVEKAQAMTREMYQRVREFHSDR